MTLRAAIIGILLATASCAPFTPTLTTAPDLPATDSQPANSPRAVSICANTLFTNPADIREVAAEQCARTGGAAKPFSQGWGFDCPLLTMHRVTFVCEPSRR